MTDEKFLKPGPKMPIFHPVSSPSHAALQSLATGVAEQIDATQRLCFKLEQQQMTLASGRSTWLGETTSELEDAIEKFQASQLSFYVVLSRAASELNLAPESTLREIAAAVEEPWSYIFAEGRESLRLSLERVESLKREIRTMLARAYLSVSSALTLLGVDTPVAYDANGTLAAGTQRAIILNTRT
jgi:hypothetical protein